MSRYLAAALLLALSGCSGLKLEGGCTYVRSVTLSYQCPADGKLEHYRVAPGEQP